MIPLRLGIDANIVVSVKNHSRSTTPTRPLQVDERPGDNIFLECADAARAGYLITGNRRHLPKFWKKTKVITSREFIDMVVPHLLT